MTRFDRGPHALRLLKARLAAGYTSGHTAAERFGWPTSTYTSDEAGRRTMSPDRLALYAAAYHVPVAWLMDEISDNDRSEEAARARMLETMSVADIRIAFPAENGNPPSAAGASERLAKARKDAGFPSVRAAAAHYGWVVSTAYAHENGSARYGSAAAQRYGLAYGADPGWLVTGVVPPCPPDRTPAEWPTGGPRGTRETVAALASEQPFHEQINVSTAPLTKAPSGRRWGANTVVVFARKVPPGGRFRVGDRLVVNRRGAGEGFYAGAMGRGAARVFFLYDGEERPDATLGRIEAIVVEPTWRDA